MSRTHLTPLSLLLLATVGTMAAAQTPSTTPQKAPPKTHADSVAAGLVVDSAAPKHSRFGGFMNKAKEVAASKAGQKAAEIAKSKAVQGAAVGVECTVVPGAAVASAVTGTCLLYTSDAADE